MHTRIETGVPAPRRMAVVRHSGEVTEMRKNKTKKWGVNFSRTA